MRQGPLVLMLLALGFGLAGCTNATYVSPNDGQYARSGAPRAGEPEPPQGGGYRPLGTDSGGPM
jgi:hypothetical protein